VRALAAKRDDAAEISRECEAFLAAAKKILSVESAIGGHDKASSSDHKDQTYEEYGLAVCSKLIEKASVHREGSIVAVHAEVASGLNKLIAAYLKLENVKE
jgi:hypothetical protein